jgi:hypothetical protein
MLRGKGHEMTTTGVSHYAKIHKGITYSDGFLDTLLLLAMSKCRIFFGL